MSVSKDFSKNGRGYDPINHPNIPSKHIRSIGGHCLFFGSSNPCLHHQVYRDLHLDLQKPLQVIPAEVGLPVESELSGGCDIEDLYDIS